LAGHIVTGDDPRVAHGKPAPDLFLVALGDFSLSPGEVNAHAARSLVFEDSPNGIQVRVLCARYKITFKPKK
jgi:pseudouridine-5'-monophosphatase